MTEEWSFDVNQYKTCKKCGNSQPPENFSKNRNTKDGLQTQCKACNAAYALANRERISQRDKARRLVDGDKMRAQSRANYQKHREKRRIAAKKYYSENKHLWSEYHQANYSKMAERKRAVSKKWREDNPERYRQQMRDWLEKNLDKHNEHARQRRARLRQATIAQVTTRDIRKLMHSRCIYCGSAENITVDHVIPLARGGSHSIGNLTSACKTCNSKKRDSFIMEWRKRESPRT
jgi:5-methylcytosine-specific restriction endonuclease McrA